MTADPDTVDLLWLNYFPIITVHIHVSMVALFYLHLFLGKRQSDFSNNMTPNYFYSFKLHAPILF